MAPNGYQWQFLVTLPLHFSLYDKYIYINVVLITRKRNPKNGSTFPYLVYLIQCEANQRDGEKKRANMRRTVYPTFKCACYLVSMRKRKTVKR